MVSDMTWTFNGTAESADEIVRANWQQPFVFVSQPVGEDGPRMWMGDQIIRPGDTLTRDGSDALSVTSASQEKSTPVIGRACRTYTVPLA